jgi:hypothetical protein
LVNYRQRPRIGDGRAIYDFLLERYPVNEQIVEILFCCSIEYFQPKPQPNNEQKADKMYVSPAIANANVVRSLC